MTATTKRTPGMLPKLLPMLPPDAPEHMKELAIRQDQINQRLWMCLDNSLPSVHGLSHRGGADNLAGTQTPSTVSLGATGTPGAAQLGFAPILHVHPLSDALEGLGGLSGVSTDESGASVYDRSLRRLLEEVLLEIMTLVDLEQQAEEESVSEAPILRVAVNQAAPGTTVLAAAQAGRQHYARGGMVTLSAAGSIKFTDDWNDLTGPFDLSAQGGFVMPTEGEPMIAAAPGGALNLVTTGGAARGVILVETR